MLETEAWRLVMCREIPVNMKAAVKIDGRRFGVKLAAADKQYRRCAQYEIAESSAQASLIWRANLYNNRRAVAPRQPVR